MYIIINVSYEGICVEFEKTTTQHCSSYIQIAIKYLKSFMKVKYSSYHRCYILPDVYNYIGRASPMYTFSNLPNTLKCTKTGTVHVLGLTMFNEGAYVTFKSIFHKALNLF